jgi:DNA-binding NarL/FixJ family response regulator
MPSLPLTVAVLVRARGEMGRIAAVLEKGDVHVAQGVPSLDQLDTSSASELDVVVLSCVPSSSEVRQEVAGVKRCLPEIPVVVLVDDRDTSQSVREALEADAEGVLLGSRFEEALVATVHAASVGQISLPQSQYRHARPVVLSHREREVLRLAVGGMTNDAIAATLFVSRSTVKSHLTSAFAKLSVRSRSEAAAVLSNPDEPATRLLFYGQDGEADAAGDRALAGSGA